MARRTGHHPLRALSRRRVVAVVVLVIWGMVLVGLSISKRAHGALLNGVSCVQCFAVHAG